MKGYEFDRLFGIGAFGKVDHHDYFSVHRVLLIHVLRAGEDKALCGRVPKGNSDWIGEDCGTRDCLRCLKALARKKRQELAETERDLRLAEDRLAAALREQP